MAKVTEYPRITKMKDNDILLVDGPDGTRTILQTDASKQMGGEVIMVNESAGDSTKVVINTTSEDIELATMADLEPVEEDAGEAKAQLDALLEIPLVYGKGQYISNGQVVRINNGARARTDFIRSYPGEELIVQVFGAYLCDIGGNANGTWSALETDLTAGTHFITIPENVIEFYAVFKSTATIPEGTIVGRIFYNGFQQRARMLGSAENQRIIELDSTKFMQGNIYNGNLDRTSTFNITLDDPVEIEKPNDNVLVFVDNDNDPSVDWKIRVTFFNANLTFLSQIGYGYFGAVPIPQNAAFFKLSLNKYVNNEQVTLTPSDIVSGKLSAGVPGKLGEIVDSIIKNTENVNSTLKYATGIEAIPIQVKGKYLHITNNVIDVQNPATSTSGYGYFIIPCSPGEEFVVSGVSSNTEPMAWAFTDENYTIKTKAGTNMTIADALVTAPAGAAYLIVHDKAPYRLSYSGASLAVTKDYVNASKTYYPIYARNGSWANSTNEYAVTIGRFDIPDGAYEISLETNRPIDAENGHYRLGYTFFSTPVGTPQYTTTGVVKIKEADSSPIYGFGDRIEVPDRARSVAFTIVQYDSNNTGIPLRKNSFNGYILRLCDYSDMAEINSKIDSARKKQAESNPSPLTLLHFSDIHGDTAALNRIVKQAESLNYISDMICTGDIVADTYEDAATFGAWWNPKVMTCIGNHDTATYTSQTGYDWTAVSMANRDAYYIAPFESNWGITHTSGTSYYYKDYTSEKVRLIVLDAMLYARTAVASEADAQNQWLTDLLASAKTNNLHVLIACHSPHDGAVSKVCSFSRYGQRTMEENLDCNLPQAVIDIVASAKTNGLNFVGYIVGHTHNDYIWDAENDGKQLMYCVACANVVQRAQWIEADLYKDTKHNAYNIVTIDTANTLVKIIRGGGADMDDHMRTRKAICIDYSTGTIVGEVL